MSGKYTRYLHQVIVSGSNCTLVFCSYYKTLLDTVGRFRYIEHAYKNMQTWMKQGNEDIQKLKRYLHRHLKLPNCLPASLDPDDATDVYHHFGYHYIQSLLDYCSDDIKPSKFSPICPPHTHTLTHISTHTQIISSWA